MMFRPIDNLHISRRGLCGLVAALAPTSIGAQIATISAPNFQLPMGVEGELPGDRCHIRHGYACENTGFNAGWWHTGENWYLDKGDSAGALVYAVAAGEVVYANADYPGRVVIIAHEAGLFSMYGHLDFDLLVTEGDVVERGRLLGTVLYRTDGRSPSHLHFEIRRFLLESVINGSAPRYPVACGYNCPPGPGYWPMADSDHPSDLGWLNPTHVIGRSALDPARGGSEVMVVNAPVSKSTALRSSPDRNGQLLGEMPLNQGDRFKFLESAVGEPSSRETSAEAYSVWARVENHDGLTGWMRVMEDSDETTGEDGRPSAVRFNLIPVM